MPRHGRTRLRKIIPTSAGQDIFSAKGDIDGHVRVETYPWTGKEIFIDLFDSSVRDADEAHITSESFPTTGDGAREATKFLRDNGFGLRLTIG